MSMISAFLSPPSTFQQLSKKKSFFTAHNTARCVLNPDDLISKQVVYLGSQHVGDEGAAAVAVALRHPASKITQVTLDSCDLTCAGAISLAEGLRGNTVLEELVLYDNSIADDGATALADALAHPKTALRVLSIPRNRIGPKGGAALGKMIATNLSLQVVYLMAQTEKVSGGGMGDEGAFAWAHGISKNHGKFWFVNLNGNGITEKGMHALRHARVEGKHVVFPVDPYPGPRTAWKIL